MRRHHLLASSSLFLVIPLLVAACGSSPEAAGDACETDGDPCPSGMKCAAGGEDGETICQVKPGSSCDANAEDPFCLGDSECTELDGKNVCTIPPGGECDLEAENSYCQAPTICGPDEAGKGYCGLPPGATCDPAIEKQCAGGLICETDAENVSTCAILEAGECDPTLDDPFCAGNLTCAELEAGGHACYPPVVASGRVFDAQSDAGIEAAHVMALDDQKQALTDVAISGVDGAYDLEIPVARKEDGSPIDATFTLRSAAQDYQPFPSGLRTSLPIQTSQAERRDDPEAGNGWIIELPLTDIALLALPEDEQGRPSISGTVLAEDRSAGVLVVAENGNEGEGISSISDKGGAYTIFNVPQGSYTVAGYAAGVVLESKQADVGGEPLTGVDLVASDTALGSISGSVNIVNAPGGSVTSVVLVVESTFDDTFVRGEVPRGLRTPLSGPPDVSGSFSIADVPPGRYVVLAAFENDGLVRDPDPNIAGTQIVTVEMGSPGTSVDLDDSFKITEALEVFSPGKDEPEAVSGTPTFEWADDSSEEFYTVVVYDAFGNLTWETEIPGVSGGEASVEYGGEPLESGMYYQWRATSWRQSGNGDPGPISTTEDLRGVFFVE